MAVHTAYRVLRWIVSRGLGEADSEDLVAPAVLTADLAEGVDYESRVRNLLASWGAEVTNPELLDRAWREAFDRSPAGVSVRRLREMARDCGSHYYRDADEVESWRRRLSFRLITDLRLPAVLPDPGAESPVDELDLRGIGLDWPAELLCANAFRTVPSLVPDRVPDLPLDSTWVELQFVDTRTATAVAASPARPAGRDEYSVQLLRRSTDLRSVLLRASGTTFVVGAPGSGKSTLVNWVARESIRDPRFPFLLPLLVRLRDYGFQAPEGSLLTHAIRRCGIKGKQVESWEQAVTEMARHDPKSVVLLLDGLDELPRQDEHLRTHVLREIDALGRRFTVIVTTRPAALPVEGGLSRARVYKITDLSPAASNDLIGKWCEAAGMLAAETEQLKERVYGNPDLQRMVRNPFLLTCLCTIAFQSVATREPLPTQRAEVYRRCLDVFKAHRHPKQARPLTDTDLRLMSRLAFWLLHDAPHAPRLVFDVGDVLQACGEDSFFHDAVEPCRLVHQWDARSQILYFSHATFHEYLAASHLLAGGKAAYERVLSEKRFDPNWAEVLAFLGASDPAPDGSFWRAARAMADGRDQFGGVFLLLARWLREAGAPDCGIQLLGGLNVLDKLWEEIFKGVDPKRFIAEAAELAPEEFATRFEAASDDGTIGQLHREFLRVLKQTPLPRFSNLFVTEILDATSDSSGLPQEHRLTRESLARLRRELESGRHDEKVSRRVIQVLGLAKDFLAIPLLETLASRSGPLQSTAIKALGMIGGLEAFRVLDRLLGAGTGAAEWELLVAGIGEMREDRATSRLLRILAATDLDDPRAGQILCALQDHTISRDGAKVVLDFLKSPHTETRDYAACVLYEVATTPEISEALAHAAQSDDEDEVREAALLSFEHHSRPEDFDWLEAIVLNCDGEFEPTEREAALMSIGDLATRQIADIDRIIRLLEYCMTQTSLEKTAVNIRGGLGSRHAGPIIELCGRVLSTPSEPDAKVDNFVAEEACRVLGEQENPEALPVLLSIARAEQVFERVREAAARAVTRIAPERLLAETSGVCRRVLGQFSLETGRLVFDAGILNESGSLIQLADAGPQPHEVPASGRGRGRITAMLDVAAMAVEPHVIDDFETLIRWQKNPLLAPLLEQTLEEIDPLLRLLHRQFHESPYAETGNMPNTVSLLVAWTESTKLTRSPRRSYRSAAVFCGLLGKRFPIDKPEWAVNSNRKVFELALPMLERWADVCELLGIRPPIKNKQSYGRKYDVALAELKGDPRWTRKNAPSAVPLREGGQSHRLSDD